MVYYFTYGTSYSFPFIGGWTKIKAPDYKTACAVFRAYHSDQKDGILNCSDIYEASKFRETEMYKTSNLGSRCHETITVQRYVY